MIKLGSLFDGAGGFPFAAQQYGIKPVWASEIEPFPVAVTTKRFPDMKHLGDVTKINGAEIEPVDIITFGSPCQDLSVAGKRAGLDGERSGLFMQAIRIIKEMRGATNGRYPAIAVWENVPGAFSSAKGEDFRAVLETFCQVIDENADVPRPANGKWSYAGEIVGDGYSVAWRTLDAQYWGVPQRRRRIFLVADFRGGRAGEILFKREGLSRNFAESRAAWKGITKSLAFGSGDKERNILCRKEYGISAYESNSMKSSNPHSGVYEADTARCLDLNGGNPACNQGGIAIVQVHDTRGNGNGEICPTITGDHENRVTDYTAVLCVALDRAAYNQGQNAQFDPGIDDSGRAFTVIAKGPGAVCYPINTMVATRGGKDDMRTTFGVGADGEPQFTLSSAHEHAVCYAVDCRNARLQEVNGTLQAKPNGGISYNLNNCTLILTPTTKFFEAFQHHGYRESNCAGTLTAGQNSTIRGDTPVIVQPTPVEIILRRLTPTECARLQGMPDWWCDDVPHSDSAEYKMWGNGMALPCVMYVMEGVAEVLNEEDTPC